MLNEHDEQVALINWFRMQHKSIKYALFAIPNGGLRNIRVAIKLKQEGVLAGVSDLFLMVSRGTYHGCFIEMKTEKGKLSDKQKVFLSSAENYGYYTIIGYGFQDAKNKLQEYLNIK